MENELMEKETPKIKRIFEKNKKRIILICIIAFAILAGLLGIYFKGYKAAENKYIPQIEELEDLLKNRVADYVEASEEVIVGLIDKKIQNIGELSTMEYLYTNANKFTDNYKLFDKYKIPGTEKSFIAKWDGKIKAGINVEEISVEVNKEEKIILIHLPEAKITSHEIDEDSYELLDENNNIFNRISPKDSNQLEKESKQLMEERALESGILEKAYDNAKTIISELIYTDVVKEQGYSITFNETE